MSHHLDDDDIYQHLAEETAENIARGMSPLEARDAARRKFGNVLHAREATRAVWVPLWLDQLAQDSRYALRSLRHNPSFATVVLLSLALGIGVNTAVFSVLNTLLLRPLPYQDSARLVVYAPALSARFKPDVLAADFAEWRTRAKSFQYLVAYQYQDATLASSQAATRIRQVAATPDFWPLSGAQPALGRLPADTDRPDVVLISHGLFLRQFGADPAVIGTPVLLAGKPVTIIGVLAPSFRFHLPQDRPGTTWREVDLYLPAPPPVRGDRDRYFIVGKLQPTATLSAALTEIKTIQAANLQTYPDRWFPGVDRIALEPLQERLAGPAGQAILILQAAGIFVLLIACANIANLLLARTAARQREVSIRLALGAGPGRLLRQFFAEGLVLSLLGAALGLPLASGLLWGLAQVAAQGIPRLAEAAIDLRVLLFTATASLFSATLFCLGPALTILKRPVNPTRLNPQQLLVAAEVALAVILLAAAGLLVKSSLLLHATVPGFAPEQTLVLQLSLTKTQYKARPRLTTLIDEIIAQLETLPGVQAVGIAESQGYLLQGGKNATPAIVDQFQDSLVSPGYFAAMGMKLLAGRWLTAADPADATVINETMAKRAFGTQNPLGQEILKLGRPVRIVGVVANLKYAKLDAEPGPELFRGYRLNLSGLPTLSIVARVQGDPLLLAAEARRRIAALEPQESIHGVQTLANSLSDSVAPRRFNLWLLSFFAAAALLMASVGIYGVISYSVTQRTREIGIRLALGAKPWLIASLLLRQGLAVTALGLALGLAAAYALTTWMASLLYNVQPHDPSIFAAVTLLLALIALLACLLPALRATRVDPLTALRQN